MSGKPESDRAGWLAELAAGGSPGPLSYLWRIYLRLRRRQAVGMTISPVGWPDIDAFVRHSGKRLAPWEIEVLEDLDDLYLDVRANPDKEPDGDR